VLQNVNVSDVTVELVDTGGDITVLSAITIQNLIQTGGGDVVRITVSDVLENVDVDVLNDSNVAVQVTVLGESNLSQIR
jgi:YbbR domain-containing protein